MEHAVGSNVAENSVENSVTGIPGRNGGTLLPGGQEGNKGGTGRPPNEFKAAMQALASRDDVLESLKRITDDPDHPHYMAALKHVTEHGYGKAPQTVNANIEGEITVKGYIGIDPEKDI